MRRTHRESKENCEQMCTINRKENFAFVELLKACTKKKDLRKGTALHANILKLGLLESNPYIASTLINMYAKCGALAKAKLVLKELPVRDVAMWNALIAGYANQGFFNEAMNCFQEMQKENLSPDAITYICILKACGLGKAIDVGKQIYDQVAKEGLLAKDTMLGTALVDMYSKCGALDKAEEVLESIPIRNTVSWSALLTGYAQWDKGNEAIICFERMKSEGLTPDGVAFICVLKACGCIRAIEKGNQVHNEIVKRGLREKDVVVGTAIVDMYAKCGKLVEAQRVFEALTVRNVISWSSIIQGYTQQELYNEALNCFELMRAEGIDPNAVTYICILKVCGDVRLLDRGKQIHKEIISRHLLSRDTALGTALADMYAKCGEVGKSQEVLEVLTVRDVVTWSALIAGHTLQGQGHEALKCFKHMQEEGLSVDEIGFIYGLQACSSIGALDKGQRIHEEIARKGFLEKDIALGTALVDMYAKCGLLTRAQEVLEELPIQGVASWNALITGFVQEEHGYKAFDCFERMQKQGISPNSVTFLCILKACSCIGAVNRGKDIHYQVACNGLLKDVIIGTALVDMYAKCGLITKAEELFENLPNRNVVSWSALISGYSQQGRGPDALNCIERMQSEGHSPNAITFLCVLSACIHSGLFVNAEMLLMEMTKAYEITPELEHQACMVLAYACAGQFDKAVSIIKVMPPSDYPAVWLALLRACLKWGHVKLGRLAFCEAVLLEDNCAAAYILMANIFSSK